MTICGELSALSTLIAQSLVPVYIFYRSQKLYHVPYRFRAAAGTFVTAFSLSMLGGELMAENILTDIVIKLLMLAVFVGAVFAFRLITVANVAEMLKELRLMKILFFS